MGVISSATSRMPADPEWKDDAGITDFLAFMQKYFPGEQGRFLQSLYAYHGRLGTRESSRAMRRRLVA